MNPQILLAQKFIKFVTTKQDNAALGALNKKKVDKMFHMGLSLQPYNVANGPSLEEVDRFFIVIDGKLVWRFHSALRAVDVWFKVLHSWHLTTPPECEQVLYLLQRGVYRFETDFDVPKPHVTKVLQLIELS